MGAVKQQLIDQPDNWDNPLSEWFKDFELMLDKEYIKKHHKHNWVDEEHQYEDVMMEFSVCSICGEEWTFYNG